MKCILFTLVVSFALVGCSSSESMNKQEIDNFAPKKGSARDPKAAKGIQDFKARFEATHGGATNAPAQAKTPGSNTP